MSLNVDSIVAKVKKTLKGLRLLKSVSYYPFVSENDYGARSYGTVQSLDVVLEYKIRFLGRSDVTQQQSTHNITILQAMTVNKKDKFVLPDGTEPQIQDINGPYLSNGIPVTQVYF